MGPISNSPTAPGALLPISVVGPYPVAPDVPGLSLRPYRTLDGQAVADIRLDSVPDEPAWDGDASAALERVLDLAATALCAESMAIIAELNAATLQYARTRRQFRIVDDREYPLPPGGQDGKILAKRPALFMGYIPIAEETKQKP